MIGPLVLLVDLPKDRCLVGQNYSLTPKERTAHTFTSLANDSSVPGKTQTATFLSSDAANPHRNPAKVAGG